MNGRFHSEPSDKRVWELGLHSVPFMWVVLSKKRIAHFRPVQVRKRLFKACMNVSKSHV